MKIRVQDGRGGEMVVRRRARAGRRDGGLCRALQRCALFFGPICAIPALLLLLITTDNYLRPPPPNTFLRPQFASHIKGPKDTNDWSKTINVSAIERRFERRRKHLKTSCRKLGLDRPGTDALHKPNPWEYFVDDKHNLVWCNVFKAASSSWMYNFNLLAGYSPAFLQKTKLVPMHLARQRYPRPTVDQLRQALNRSGVVSFLIVRHPLERLLSAYKDKLQFALPLTHHSKLGMEIVAKYRKRKVGKENPGVRPSRYQRWPSFSEFVQYLVEASRGAEPLDMHWTPVARFCTPCQLPPRFVAHTETLADEQRFLIQAAGLQRALEPQWRNGGREGRSADHVAKYYSQLTRSQILQLYHIYRYDFELFNYTLSGYLELGRPDEDPSVLLAAITQEGTPKEGAPRIY